MEIESRRAKMKANEEEQFNNWIAKSETKLMLSMIPQAENPDVVKLLLRSAYDAGNAAGGANVMIEVVEAMLKDRPKQP